MLNLVLFVHFLYRFPERYIFKLNFNISLFPFAQHQFFQIFVPFCKVFTYIHIFQTIFLYQPHFLNLIFILNFTLYLYPNLEPFVLFGALFKIHLLTKSVPTTNFKITRSILLSCVPDLFFCLAYLALRHNK